jgi:hypothetical protein
MIECRLNYRMEDGMVTVFVAEGATESEAYMSCMRAIVHQLRTTGQHIDLTRILRPPGRQFSGSKGFEPPRQSGPPR